MVLSRRTHGSAVRMPAPKNTPTDLPSAPHEEAALELANVQALYERHASFVQRNLRRLGVSDTSIEDATQEVFLVAHRRFPSFDPSTSSPRTWLFGIVLRVTSNELRARRRRNARFETRHDSGLWRAAADHSCGPAELAEAREGMRLVERALLELSDDHRQIWVLVELESLSVAGAAGVLDIKLNTAYGRLRSARAELRDIIRRLMGEADVDGGLPGEPTTE